MTLPIIAPLTPSRLSILSAYNHERNLLTFNGTLLSIGNFQELPILPPLEPLNAQPNELNFNYKGLGRLPTQPFLGLVQTVYRTEVLIDGVDYSHMLNGATYLVPISGISEGSLNFQGNIKSNPFSVPNSFNHLQQLLETKVGSLFEWNHIFNDDVRVLVARGYVINSPKVHYTEENIAEIDLEIGCELALFSNSNRLSDDLYCGSLPETAKDAAEIYARNLITKVYPSGHILADRNDQVFPEETPYDYLQSLYAPINYDVRCSRSSREITITERKVDETPTEITFEEVLELPNFDSSSYEPVRRIRVFHDYDVISEVQQETTEYTEVSGEKSNNKPWFQGGYTETTYSITTLGDTEIYSKATTRGFVPVNSVISQADYNQDQCAGSTIPTEFGVISTETEYLTYREHSSGSYLVTAKERQKRGKLFYQLPDSNYTLYDGILEYEKETYSHTPQVTEEVCEKNFIHLTTKRTKDTYGLTENRVYVRKSTETDFYQSEGVSPSANVAAYVGSGIEWTKAESRGERDSTTGAFINQPVRSTTEEPPQATFIRPKQQAISAFVNVFDNDVPILDSLRNDSPVPLEAPFCYSEQQLRNYGYRYLQENNGLSQGKQIIVPYFYRLQLGQTVRYTDGNNQTHDYLVFAIAISQEQSQTTKTVTLSKVVRKAP